MKVRELLQYTADLYGKNCKTKMQELAERLNLDFLSPLRYFDVYEVTQNGFGIGYLAIAAAGRGPGRGKNVLTKKNYIAIITSV